MPKEILPIVDKPTIQFIIEEAIASGIEEIMIITGKSKRAIENHFDQSVVLDLELEKKQNHELLEFVRSVSEMVDIHNIRQKQPKGLGQMIRCYDEVKSTVLGVQEAPHSQVSKYGIVDGMQLSDRVYTVRDLVEKPSAEEAPSNVAFLGRYIIKPEIFEILRDTKPGKGGEIQLTDALKELALRDDMYAYSFEGKKYDVGNKQGFLEATVETALR